MIKLKKKKKLAFKTAVYNNFDWNINPLSCAVKSLFTIMVSFVFFLVVRRLNQLKYWLNGIDQKIKSIKI
jgi:hypothetical protein